MGNILDWLQSKLFPPETVQTKPGPTKQQSGENDSDVQNAYSDSEEKLHVTKAAFDAQSQEKDPGFKDEESKDSPENVTDVQNAYSDREKKLHVTKAAFDAQSQEKDPGFKDEESKDSPENVTDVTVITPLPSPATVAFLEKLGERLRGAYQICLTETDVNTFNKQDKERNLVMVICNNHTRINADVNNALKDINENLQNRMFVIILHCQKKKHLSTELLSGKLKAAFPKVQHFVEMAFDQDLLEGIFECEMNNSALEDIAQKKDAFARTELLISN